MKKSDPVYEEIFDHTKAKKLSQLQNEVLKPGYENVEGVNEVCNEKAKLTNGVQTRRPVTPSAPSEDDFNNLARVTAVPNEYGVLRDTLVKSPADIQVQQVRYGVDDVNSDVKGTSNPDIDNTDDELNSAGIEDLKHEDKSNIEYSTAGPVFGLDWQAEQGNTYCQFEDLIPLQKVGSDDFQKQTCSEDIGNIAVVDSDNTHSDRVNPLSLNHPSPTPELIPEPFDEIRVIIESGDNIDLPATETTVCEQGNTDIEHTEEGQRVRLVTETKVADGNGNTQEYPSPQAGSQAGRQAGRQSDNQSVSQSVSQSGRQAGRQSVSQAGRQSASQPVRQSGSQSGSQTIRQSVSQSVRQSGSSFIIV